MLATEHADPAQPRPPAHQFAEQSGADFGLMPWGKVNLRRRPAVRWPRCPRDAGVGEYAQQIGPDQQQCCAFWIGQPAFHL